VRTGSAGETPSPASPAFLQRRLRLFAAAVLGISAFLFAGVSVLSVVSPFFRAGRTEAVVWLHLGQLAFVALIYALAKWGPPSAAFVAGADALAMAGVAVSSAAMGIALDGPQARLIGPPVIPIVMATVIVMITRAFVIPSSPLRTWLVSSFAATAMVTAAVVVAARTPTAAPPYAIAVPTALWSAVGIAVATFASRVVYGLAVRVHETRQLGQYTLENRIGEGGMGVVYKARHAMLRRPTAIKLLAPSLSGSELDLARFEREVQATSALTHPNTIAIYDYGRTPDGRFYYAMEYLDGIDLQVLVERDGPQPQARVIHIMTQVLGALAEAHDAGIVHRDIKPANILLSERGGMSDVAKVLDFGLAKRLTEDPSDPTQSGANVIMGTPLYLAPEAITSPTTVDGRSDLYALACVAYYLLTGTLVFDGEQALEILGKHLGEAPVPPSERIGTAISPSFEAIILACLEKRPDRRPPDARALRDALLACGVPPWTERDARSWWARRGDHVRRQTEPSRGVAVEPTAVTIDLHARTAY